MTRDSTDASSDIERSIDDSDDRRVCRMTGREDGLVGKYDIWLCRQSFRELAPKMGFEKYD
ncbi:30S ribosomal protein S14 [Haloarcula laminariae]|uniref:30S ribosomal protein S14 n=1 Tax=Haloarcula laminariae TaxID=2961577 RepID=UPI0024049259|nr:30S ribosomal protein S14 [Halomicroarcula sp. FL173]